MIQGEHIYLRALEPSDIDLLYQWENDVDYWNVADTFAPFSRHQIEQYLLSVEDIYANKQLRLMICLKADDRAVGCIDLFDFDAFHSRAGVGILVAHPDDRTKGIGEATLHLIVDYAFQTLGVQQLYCSISLNNKNSQRLFEKCGFVQSGIKKHWRRMGDKWVDELFYQLLRP